MQQPANRLDLPAMKVGMWAYYDMVAPSQLAKGKDFLRGSIRRSGS